MKIVPLSDVAVLVDLSGESEKRVFTAVAALERARLEGVSDIVPAFTTVAVFYDPVRVCAGDRLISAYERVCEWIAESLASAKSMSAGERHVVELPVCYEGEFAPDLAAVAAHAGLAAEEVVRRHSTAEFTVGAVGFTPGFPYLRGLPPELHTPRRSTPRALVPAGSVGIGGAQTGVYSFATPGGWNLIGRTPQQLFSAEKNPPAFLQTGDRVRVRRISPEEFAALHRASSAPAIGTGEGSLEILRTRGLLTIQDLGRAGQQRFGISPGGAVDRVAARVANLLVGNPEDAAVLECTLAGPDLGFARAGWIAITGAEVEGVPGWQPRRVRAGERLSLRRFIRGARAYVAVAGGIDVPLVLGSRATYLAAKLGGVDGRALREGQRLPLGPVAPNFTPLARGWAAHEFTRDDVTIRVLCGPQGAWFSAASWRAFLEEEFRVSPNSDRMGLRLDGPRIGRENADEMFSEGVAFGSIQVPPDGLPIALLADRQTLGGYPKIATAIAVDLPRLAQLRPGDRVRFSEVSPAAAQSLYFAQERQLALLRAGLAAPFS